MSGGFLDWALGAAIDVSAERTRADAARDMAAAVAAREAQFAAEQAEESLPLGVPRGSRLVGYRAERTVGGYEVEAWLYATPDGTVLEGDGTYVCTYEQFQAMPMIHPDDFQPDPSGADDWAPSDWGADGWAAGAGGGD